MALTDKDILITPNKGQTAEPKIEFKGASATQTAQTISLNVYPTDNGTISFEGSAGQLFSITNSLSGTIYSVNDVSGIPSIEVLDTGNIKLGQYNGNILIGKSTDDGTKFQINGGISTPTTWINYSTSNYNGYNENIRLYPAGNNVSTIAFGSTGVSGTPWNAVLGYSDRLEIRQADQWQLRSYANYIESYGSSRAPTFYDSNNTAYYTDPASTSNLLGLTVTNTITGSVSGSAATVVQTTDPAASTFRILLGNGTNAAGTVYNKSALYWNDTGSIIQGANISGNAATVTNGVYTNTNQTISGIKTFSNGLIVGDTQSYPNYEFLLDFGADVANTWRKLVTVSSPTGTYQTIGFKISIIDPQGNHAMSGTVNTIKEETYYVACVRTNDLTQNTPDACYVTGPSNRIRAIKTSVGNYEIQIQNDVQYREYRGSISVYAVSGSHTVTYSNGTTVGTAIATYNSTVNASTLWVQKLGAKGQIVSDVATGTAPFTIASTTVVTNLNADLLDGQHGSYYQTASNALTTSTSFGGDVSGTYNAIVVADDSHTHAFNNLTSKTGGTGTYTTSGDYRAPIFYDSNDTNYYVDPNSVSSFAGLNLNSGWYFFGDENRDMAAAIYYPNSQTRAVRFSFANASTTGTGGNYAGVIHFHPWSGTTASTGDASYQIAIGSSAVNGTGVPRINIRNGIDTTWNSWYTVPLYGVNSYSSSLYATIYYDSDNTAYYTDPAGTSNLSGLTVASTISGSISGNAGSATTLQTARTINGISFNGSANIVVPTIYDTGFKSIINPDGAQFVTGTATVTGAIAVTLPVGMTNSMIRMTIRVYEYTTNESFDIYCGGYTYTTGNTWANNPFAYIVGNPGIDRRFTVRFGYTAGGKAVVYIGELASTWSYPQVFVTDIQCGYSGNAVTYTTGWSIGFQSSAFENVTATITNSQVGYAVSTNTANSSVLRDASGNFSAGTISATIQTPNGANGVLFGDDVILADRNVANTVFISGGQNADRGYINFSTSTTNSLGAIAGGALTWNSNTVWHAGNDGSGSGLDADLLDGMNAASANTASTVVSRDASGNFSAGTITATLSGNASTASSATRLTNFTSTTTTSAGTDNTESAVSYISGISLFGQTDGALYSHVYSSSWKHNIYGDYRTGQLAVRGKNNGTWQSWRTVWDSGNLTNLNQLTNGPGYITGESDTLATVTGRGITTRASSGAFATNTQGTPGLEIYGGGTTEPAYMTFHRPGLYAVRFGLDGTDLKVGGWSMGNVAYKLWHEGNDGSGSTLDADLLDGNHASAFATSSHNHSGVYVERDEVKSFGTISVQAVAGSGVSCTTAEFITWLENQGFFDYVHSYAKCSWSYAGNNDISDTGFGANFELAGCVIETWTDNSDDTTRGNITVQITAPTTGGTAGSKILVYNDQGSGYSPGWRQIWNSNTLTNLNQLTNGPGYITGESDTLATVTGRGATTSTLVRINNQLQVGQNTNGTAWIDAYGGFAYYGADSNSTGMKINSTGNATFYADVRSPIYYDSADTGYYWNPNTSSAHRLQTPTGYLDLGSMNASFCHFQTDRAKYYFNKTINVDGEVQIYTDTINRFAAGTLVLRGGSPTIYMRDTDNNVAMLHCNSNLMYILRGATDSETWTQVGSYWPVYWDLTNNNATFGGSIWAASSVTAYSDLKLKENIKTIDNALSKTLQLRGVYYTRKDDENKDRRVGVIAQEIKEVLPEVVRFHQDAEDIEGTYAVDYGNITGLLIEAIKEQQSQIDELKELVKKLLESK